MQEDQPKQSLWTWDFTVITLGSVVSMMGGVLTNFALSIMVLDYTGSTFLYVTSIICGWVPGIVFPLLAGPYLDRVSRKKVVYRLDFLSAGLYLGLFLLLRAGWYSYPLMLTFNFVTGAINSVYQVAYDSLYPNLAPKGLLTKAYSVASMLWPLAAMSEPIAAFVYERLGDATPLLAADAVCFFIAACFERTIRHKETHMAEAPPPDGTHPLRQFGQDFREGLTYIRGEPGLLFITAYYVVDDLAGNGAGNLYLPFFRNNAALFAAWPVAAVTLYSIITNFGVFGRLAGGAVHYKVKLPAKRKFTIALCVYLLVNFTFGAELYLPVPLMALAFFLTGMLGVTSYNIRITAMQSYIPDSVRARFNATFNTLCTMGSIAGALLGGVLAEFLPERRVVLLMACVCVLNVFLTMIRGRKHVAAIYNRDV